MTFADRLKHLREKQKPKIYQKELADAIGVSRQAITMWETGQRTPEAAVLERLADFFNVSVDYLLGRTDIPQIQSIKEPDFTTVFDATNLGDAIIRIINICSEFNISKEVMFEMFGEAVKKYGKPGGVGGVAAHGPSYPGSGVFDEEDS